MTVALDAAELSLRIYRRSLFAILILFLGLAAIVAASVFSPQGALATWLLHASWVLPVAVALLVVVQQTVLRRHRLDMESEEIKAIQHDEWRRAGMARASRAALALVLAAQLPLALLALGLPTVRAVWGMAGLTVTLGMAAQIGFFLFFDRK